MRGVSDTLKTDNLMPWVGDAGGVGCGGLATPLETRTPATAVPCGQLLMLGPAATPDPIDEDAPLHKVVEEKQNSSNIEFTRDGWSDRKLLSNTATSTLLPFSPPVNRRALCVKLNASIIEVVATVSSAIVCSNGDSRSIASPSAVTVALP